MTEKDYAIQVLLQERKKLRAAQDKLKKGQLKDIDSILRIAEKLHLALTQLLRI